MANSAPHLIPSERLVRGIHHLELLAKLLSGFASDSTLDQTEHLVLVEMLEDVAAELVEARNGLSDVIPLGGIIEAPPDHVSRAGAESEEIKAILTGIRGLTPSRRLIVWTLVEHTRLLDAMETIVDELSEGLR